MQDQYWEVKNQHKSTKKTSVFLNASTDGSSRSAKIWLPKYIFFVNNHPNPSDAKIWLPKSGSFWFIFSIKNSSVWAHFLLKSLSSKIMLNFWWTVSGLIYIHSGGFLWVPTYICWFLANKLVLYDPDSLIFKN